MLKHNKTTVSFIIVTVLVGITATWFTWDYIKNKLFAEALEDARIIARSIDVTEIQKLTATPADLNKPEYISIHQKLQFIREGHSTCRFLYLMGQKSDGSIFFFLDSQPEESKDAIFPGLIYEEASDEYKEALATGREQTVGPITDRWGHLISSLIPIYDKNNVMVATLGMDITVDDWNSRILSNILLPIVLMVSIVGLSIFLFLMNAGRIKLVSMHREKEESLKKLEKALADVKQLQGILPICSNCKQIRDGDGYWSQVESYIREHSEADFTHSICPDCVEKLYPGMCQTKKNSETPT